MIPFTKAHACGNDFLIVPQEAAQAAGENDLAALTRRLCARSTGVGADGVEFFTWIGPGSPGPESPDPKFGRIRLYNADGSIAEISGNGTRCVAAWMAEALGSKRGDVLAIETDAGLRLCSINKVQTENGFTVDVTIGMGVPKFVPHTLKLTDGSEIVGVEVSIGNPHFVILADNPEFTVTGKPWQTIGAAICVHRDFPQRTNVEFVRIVSEREIEIRIFERGVGPTTSSGSGTSAAATAVLALRRCISPLKVVAPGGAQSVEWESPDSVLLLTGSASLIARGEAW